MKIGIIGAGNIGGALARHFTGVGHSVKIANSRGPETLKKLAEETGATAVTTAEAVKDVELLVVTIPEKNVPALPKDLLASLPSDTIVIDTGNYYPSFRDGVIDALEGELTESEWVAQHLRRPVVKVFNNILAKSLATRGVPKGQSGRIALPVAGDDSAHKARVLALVDEIGFDGLDAGPLKDSWHQQPGTPAYCTDLDLESLPKALASTDRSTSAHMREEAAKKLFSLPPDTPAAEMIRQAREMWPELPQL